MSSDECSKSKRSSGIFLPTPGNVQQTIHHAQQQQHFQVSVADLHGLDLRLTFMWQRPLKEQLEPNFTGGPDKSKPFRRTLHAPQ